jgi:8-oxo-dGTP pyrophosphatase MutT (NUDIX family)
MMGKKYLNEEIISCGAITWRLNRGLVEILLIKQFRDKELWGIPKGHINKEESIAACAIREVFEETGVLIELGVRLSDCLIRQKTKQKKVVSFLATPLSHDEPRHDGYDSEVADAKWFDVKNLPNLVSYQRVLIKEACDLISIHIMKFSDYINLMK